MTSPGREERRRRERVCQVQYSGWCRRTRLSSARWVQSSSNPRSNLPFRGRRLDSSSKDHR